MPPIVTLEPNLSGIENMSRDAELPEDEVVARVYSWDGPWVSLGLFQHPESDLKTGCPIRWVKRPTGGRAVLHGHDVTVGLSIPFAAIDPTSDLSRSVRRAYRAAAEPIISALNALGVPACLGEEVPSREQKGPRSADCFAAISANDIVNRETLQKVCGCALKLRAHSVLLQASIPACPPLVDPGEVFTQPAPVSWVTIDLGNFAENLATALEERFCVRT
ncbi:MAG TPA: hypothetical protein PKA27_11460 [Fimbriimonadaceae bacterium]|nr:hypothetical protein [Fimbriimonadaceae bacterium]